MAICVHCGAAVDPAAERCPACGRPALGAGRAADPAARGRTGPSAEAGSIPAAETGAVPWEDPDKPFPENLFETWRASLFEPGRFFRAIPWGASLARPVLYYLIVAVLAGLFTLWWNALGIAVGLPMAAEAERGLSDGAEALIQFFVTPFAALIGLGLWTLVLHLFVVLLAPRRRPVAATARALCYSYGPAVFSIVPVLGALVGLVWTVVLQVVAVREAHRTTQGRAVAIVLLPAALMAAALAFLLVLAFVVVGVTAVEMLGR